MIELSIVERYIYGQLKPYFTSTLGLRVEIMPFDLHTFQNDGVNENVPVIYYRYVSGDDKNAIGPGRRLMSTVVYEIGVFHDANSFGAVFGLPVGPSVTLLTMLNYIDAAFQDNALPVNQTGGVIFSIERTAPIRIPERGPDGRLYKRDGGLFKFTVRKDPQ